MVALPFKEHSAADVESGKRKQKIIQAKCKDKECQRACNPFGGCVVVSDEGVICPLYQNKIEPGDTLQLYTGQGERKYCKNPIARFGEKVTDDMPCWLSEVDQGWHCRDCNDKGAKLLKTTTCTKSFPIKFEDLTEEIARLEGFEVKFEQRIFGAVDEIGSESVMITALYQLQDSLIKQYKAKDGDVFQVVRFE